MPAKKTKAKKAVKKAPPAGGGSLPVRQAGASGGKAEPTHRARLHYSGRVQGVGFRYTAERLALELCLTGWVKNLPDGRVELVCEGSKECIETLLARIRESALGRHIRRAQCAWEAPKREFNDFRVEFHH